MKNLAKRIIFFHIQYFKIDMKLVSLLNFVVRRYGFTYGANNSIITVKSFLKYKLSATNHKEK
ncbi:hypothetical protein TYRP_014057 [Tyrophagus putrescentiae]|nr:hypothetical protein TYRP_014057 [Tyrophagus putrescentiae]